MKFNVTADGHSAEVDVTFDGKGGFTGSIVSSDGHNGTLSGSGSEIGTLTGTASVDGHNGTFQASISGNAISGSVTVNVFLFHKTISFTGTRADV